MFTLLDVHGFSVNFQNQSKSMISCLSASMIIFHGSGTLLWNKRLASQNQSKSMISNLFASMIIFHGSSTLPWTRRFAFQNLSKSMISSVSVSMTIFHGSGTLFWNRRFAIENQSKSMRFTEIYFSHSNLRSFFSAESLWFLLQKLILKRISAIPISQFLFLSTSLWAREPQRFQSQKILLSRISEILVPESSSHNRIPEILISEAFSAESLWLQSQNLILRRISAIPTSDAGWRPMPQRLQS